MSAAAYYTLLPLLSLLALSASPTNTTMNAYDVLRSHGLPVGLLPRSIRDFSIDDAGQFSLRIDEPCTATFETKIHYNSSVSGTISYGQIASLRGVSAQELFLWFPVHEIRVDVPSSGLIYFDVGVIYKQFSLSLFESPPDCVPGGGGDLREGARIADVVSESGSGKLRYELDQANEQRSINGVDSRELIFNLGLEQVER